MYKNFIVLFLSLWINLILHSVECVPLQEAKCHVGETIQTRGFIYQIDNQTVIAPMPNLKSCCVKKERDLLYILGDVGTNSSHAITVQGIIVQKDQRYELHEVSLIANENKLLNMKSLFFAFFAVISALIFYFKNYYISLVII